MSIDEKILDIIRRYIPESVSPEELAFDRPIREMTFLDSLTVLNIVVALEKEFGIRFQMETLTETFFDINHIKEYILKQRVQIK